MHHLLRVHDFAAKRLANRLVAEAYAKNPYVPRELPDQRHRNAGFIGRARPGRNHDVERLERSDFFERDLIIAIHGDFLLEFTEVLHEVVGERIVVIDHQEHKLVISCS